MQSRAEDKGKNLSDTLKKLTGTGNEPDRMGMRECGNVGQKKYWGLAEGFYFE